MIIDKKPFIPFALFTIFLLSGCTSETPVVDSPQGVNVWIEKTMRDYYLWSDEIPESNKLDFTKDADVFFNSLLSTKDGKIRNGQHDPYSTIVSKANVSKAYMGEGYSFGFEFQYYYVRAQSRYALLVLYVLPSSPADEAGLKRGNWIYSINKNPVPGDIPGLVNLLDTSSPKTLELEIAEKISESATRTVSVTARTVVDNPVLVKKTFRLTNNNKVGYLVYNHFTAGPVDNGEDETFNNSLRTAFAQFKNDGVNEFILDLRFNGGGLVSCAQLMATMLAPETAINDIFCNLMYNGQATSYKLT